MARDAVQFQPGAILHEAIIGAFRASGDNLDQWCKRNGVNPTSARQATFGQSRGPNGRLILGRLIEAAGPDFVRHIYERRVLEHAEQIRKGAA